MDNLLLVSSWPPPCGEVLECIAARQISKGQFMSTSAFESSWSPLFYTVKETLFQGSFKGMIICMLYLNSANTKQKRLSLKVVWDGKQSWADDKRELFLLKMKQKP